MADYKISQLTPVTPTSDDLLEVSHTTDSGVTFNSGSVSVGTLSSAVADNITATDIEYSSGVSVGDKLDELSTGLFKAINYTSGSITLNAGGAINVTAADMDINSFPTGYVPLALVSWYATANGVFARSIDITATSTSSFCVLKSVETTSVTFQYQAKILYVKSAYAPV